MGIEVLRALILLQLRSRYGDGGNYRGFNPQYGASQRRCNPASSLEHFQFGFGPTTFRAECQGYLVGVRLESILQHHLFFGFSQQDASTAGHGNGRLKRLRLQDFRS